MAIAQKSNQRVDPESTPIKTAVETTKRGALGGWLPSIFSAIAVGASCVSVYVSTLQAAQLEVYMPPAFQYAMDGEGENFTIPITIANSGAQGGTVVSMELEVHNPKTNATQRFYSAYLGEYPGGGNAVQVRQFTPMAILGHSVSSQTVRFYPVDIGQQTAVREAEKRIVQDGGDFAFRLKINTAAPAAPSLLDRIQGRAQPTPVSVTMTLADVNYRATMQMRSKDWFGTVK